MISEVACMNCGFIGRVDDSVFVCPKCKIPNNLLAVTTPKENDESRPVYEV